MGIDIKHNFSTLDKKIALVSRKLSTQQCMEKNNFIEKLSTEKYLTSSSILTELQKFLITQLSEFSTTFISIIFESINPDLQISQNEKNDISFRFNSYFNSQINQHENSFNESISSQKFPQNTEDAFIKGFKYEVSLIKQNVIQEINIKIDEHNDNFIKKVENFKTGSKPTNTTEKIIYHLKNNKLIAILIVLAIIIISISQFTESLNIIYTTIESIVSNNSSQESSYELKLETRIFNNTLDTVKVYPFVKYYLLEDKGFQIQEYAGGRLKINSYNNLNNYVMLPNDTTSYYLILGSNLTKSELFHRGGGNIHFQLYLEGSDKVYLKSAPFMADALKGNYILFDLINDTL